MIKPPEKLIAPAEPIYKEAENTDVDMKNEEQPKKIDDDVIPGDKEGDLMKSFISLDNFVSPKQAYEKEASKENESMKLALMNLFDFGFTDFRINKALMEKFKDANVVAEKLCMGISE